MADDAKRMAAPGESDEAVAEFVERDDGTGTLPEPAMLNDAAHPDRAQGSGHAPLE